MESVFVDQTWLMLSYRLCDILRDSIRECSQTIKKCTNLVTRKISVNITTSITLASVELSKDLIVFVEDAGGYKDNLIVTTVYSVL